MSNHSVNRSSGQCPYAVAFIVFLITGFVVHNIVHLIAHFPNDSHLSLLLNYLALPIPVIFAAVTFSLEARRSPPCPWFQGNTGSQIGLLLLALLVNAFVVLPAFSTHFEISLAHRLVGVLCLAAIGAFLALHVASHLGARKASFWLLLLRAFATAPFLIFWILMTLVTLDILMRWVARLRVVLDMLR